MKINQPPTQEEVNEAIHQWANKETGSSSLLVSQDDGSYHISYHSGMGNSDNTPIEKFAPVFKNTVDQLYLSGELQAFGEKFTLYPGSDFFRMLIFSDN